MLRDSTFCAKSVRYNIFTNGAPYNPSFLKTYKGYTLFARTSLGLL